MAESKLRELSMDFSVDIINNEAPEKSGAFSVCSGYETDERGSLGEQVKIACYAVFTQRYPTKQGVSEAKLCYARETTMRLGWRDAITRRSYGSNPASATKNEST
ncbi:MAG: hypothetical protein IJV98_07030 [Clostridia bacterium]|nr:hypothetical protein [Clostridia bacterium]